MELQVNRKVILPMSSSNRIQSVRPKHRMKVLETVAANLQKYCEHQRSIDQPRFQRSAANWLLKCGLALPPSSNLRDHQPPGIIRRGLAFERDDLMESAILFPFAARCPSNKGNERNVGGRPFAAFHHVMNQRRVSAPLRCIWVHAGCVHFSRQERVAPFHFDAAESASQ